MKYPDYAGRFLAKRARQATGSKTLFVTPRTATNGAAHAHNPVEQVPDPRFVDAPKHGQPAVGERLRSQIVFRLP